MAEVADIKESVRQTVLAYYRDECKEMVETWRELEHKAQGNVAIAGVFIGGALAYLQEIDPQSNILSRGFIFVTVVLLTLSVVFSILALKTQKNEAPPMGDYVLTLANDVLQIEDDHISERLPCFFNDQMDGWKRVRNEAEHLITKKAKYLFWAQVFVLAAVITVAVLAVIKIFFA